MSSVSNKPTTQVYSCPPLDDSFYPLTSSSDPQALAFFKSHTGIDDEVELRNHIVRVQRKAYEICNYPCIRSFSFLRLKIFRLPAYKAALDLLKEHPKALFLDLGCCFGNDARKIHADGWPPHQIIASDLRGEFWKSGHELFKSTPSSFPSTFIEGDIFDPEFLKPSEPFYLTTSENEKAATTATQVDSGQSTTFPILSSLTSLTPLRSQISVIHTSSFFHLFSEEQQKATAQRVASLLSPQKGSMVFGSHVGRAVKGFRQEWKNPKFRTMFCHSPESWEELWIGSSDGVEEGVFKKGTVKVEARLRAVEIPVSSIGEGSGDQRDEEEMETVTLLEWSVSRL